jgi:hypothetical protein
VVVRPQVEEFHCWYAAPCGKKYCDGIPGSTIENDGDRNDSRL